jgi:hypothetical protein
MSRRIVLSVFAVAVSLVSASAADLPVHSQIGAIFADPVAAPVVVYREREYVAPIIPYNNLPNPVWARGNYNYGSSWSYYYPGPYYGGPYYGGSYYGGANTSYAVRLPYVCGLYGYCF